MANNNAYLTVNGKNLTRNEFLKALRQTSAGSFIDRERYKNKIERTRGVLVNLSTEIIRNIKMYQLSGQKLNKKTGKLQRSIEYRVIKTNNGLTSEIFSDNPLTNLYENGGSGILSIRAHSERRNKVFNKPVPTYDRHVPQHQRTYNIRALHFMRDEANKARPKILKKIAESIMKD